MAWNTEQILTAIGQAAPCECITEARLVELTGLTVRQVADSARKLIKHGLLTRVEPGCHKLTQAGRAALEAGQKIRSGPRCERTGRRVIKESLRVLAWRAIRIRKKFSVPDLIMVVAEGGERDIESNLRKYLTALCRAGILRQLPVRENGLSRCSNGYVRYLLVHDLGPQAPIWRAHKAAVYDPNEERDHPCTQDIYRAPRRRAA